MAVGVVNRGKRPITSLAGPYGHPFHPILVTIPIGAWVASLVFDIATRAASGGEPGLVNASYWLIGLGVLGAVLAAVFGLLDLLAIPSPSRAFRVGLVHMSINVVVLAAFVVDFFWRHATATGAGIAARVEVGQLVLSAVAIGVLVLSGFLGGMLAYRFGVRVADETTQAEGFGAP